MKCRKCHKINVNLGFRHCSRCVGKLRGLVIQGCNLTGSDKCNYICCRYVTRNRKNEIRISKRNES